MIGIGIWIWQAVTGGDSTPGGSVDVLTDDDALSALTDDDGTYLRDD